MNTNYYVERAMGLCGVTDSHNRNTFAKSFGELSADQSEEVLAAFTQKLSEGTVGTPAAYLTEMLKRKIADARECTHLNSVSEGAIRDGVGDSSDSKDADSEDFDSDGLDDGELREHYRKLNAEGPRCFENLSPNAHLFGVIAHLYECSRFWLGRPTCRLAFVLGGMEALVFGRLISYPPMKDHRSGEEEAKISDEQRAANQGFYLQNAVGWAKYPYGNTHEALSYLLAKKLDESLSKNPECLKRFRLG